jgi:hypothetical protein
MTRKQNHLVEVLRESTPLCMGGMGFLLVVALLVGSKNSDKTQVYTIASQYITGLFALIQTPQQSKNKEKRTEEHTPKEIDSTETVHKVPETKEISNDTLT